MKWDPWKLAIDHVLSVNDNNTDILIDSTGSVMMWSLRYLPSQPHLLGLMVSLGERGVDKVN